MTPVPKVRPQWQTADLSGYPDLVVIYLGQRALTPRGVPTIFGLGRPYSIRQPPNRTACRGTRCSPEGCSHHFGMRQYSRDFDFPNGGSAATRMPPGGELCWQTCPVPGFWHEAYFARGGMGSIYLEMWPTGGRREQSAARVGAGAVRLSEPT